MKSMDRRRSAFTLVELLVVIGIIAVLIGVLLPALGRARRQSRTVACMSTLRNLGQALGIYAAENKGSYPYGYYKLFDPNASPTPTAAGETDADVANKQVYVWWGVLRAYMRRNSQVDYSTLNSDGSRGTRFMQAFACPEGHELDAGNDFGCNMVVMPEVQWENISFFRSTNPALRPAKQWQLYPDNIVLFDSTEINDGSPFPFTRQYVVGYEVDQDSLTDPKKAYQRYRDTTNSMQAANYSKLLDSGIIFPGTNIEAQISVDDGQKGNIRWRHGDQDTANFLFADGTVRSMKADTKDFVKARADWKSAPTPTKGEVTRRLWKIKWPGGFKRQG